MLSSLAGWGSLKHQYEYSQFVACFARSKNDEGVRCGMIWTAVGWYGLHSKCNLAWIQTESCRDFWKYQGHRRVQTLWWVIHNNIHKNGQDYDDPNVVRAQRLEARFMLREKKQSPNQNKLLSRLTSQQVMHSTYNITDDTGASWTLYICTALYSTLQILYLLAPNDKLCRFRNNTTYIFVQHFL